jgi:hypothetical protein
LRYHRAAEADGRGSQAIGGESMNHVAAALLFVTLTAQSSMGRITITLPDGWRRLNAQESKILKPELKPQNKWQRRLVEQPDQAVPLIAMKHDVAGSIAASVQVFLNPIPAQMRFASSIKLARVIAFASLATFQGEYELSPHETTVGGLAAAEWVARYTLAETGGTHAMKMRGVIVALKDKYYLVGYSAPATDSADFERFETVVKSIKFGK